MKGDRPQSIVVWRAVLQGETQALHVNEGTISASPVVLRPKTSVPTGSAPPAAARQEELELQDKVENLESRHGLEFVWIKPGTFKMGSPSSEKDRYDNEGPVHMVRISEGFWLGKCEVTQGQWESVMRTQPWQGIFKIKRYVRSGANNPAVYISWNDVQKFIGRLNAAAGSKVYRLPTEAEWEYACRAGTRTRWSFGDDESQLKHYAWYADNALGEKYGHSVGTKRANPWGLYDMHGNVWEWTQDCYKDSYSGAPTDGSAWKSQNCDIRVLRGGSWYDEPRSLRSANRSRYTAGNRYSSVGFRIVRRF